MTILNIDSASGSTTVSGATATTFATASGSTVPLSPHQRLDCRHLRLGQRMASGSITAALASPSCRLHLGQQLDRRHLRLGQRLDDCRHHLSVGGLELPFLELLLYHTPMFMYLM